MNTTNDLPTIERAWILRRAGYVLVAIALVFLMLLLYIPEVKAPALVAYSYLTLGAGLVLVVLNKVQEIIQQRRIRDLTVRCLNCGWFGLGREWSRGHCCPECDSEKVILTGRLQ